VARLLVDQSGSGRWDLKVNEAVGSVHEVRTRSKGVNKIRRAVLREAQARERDVHDHEESHGLSWRERLSHLHELSGE
jgi:hypothetical protein